MLYHETEPGHFVVWSGEPINEVLHPLQIEEAWTPDQLAEIGLYQPAPPDAPPAGYVATGKTVQRVGGVVKYVYDLAPVVLTEADYSDAIVQHLDARAQEYRYDDIKSAVSYVSSSVTQWAAEAAAFVSWRDAVWAYAYTQLALVKSGQRPQPSVDDFISELPEFIAP